METQEVSLMQNDQANTTRSSTLECSYTTPKGDLLNVNLHITIRGPRDAKRTLVTFHDVGLNSTSNFSDLLNSEAMLPYTERCCIYHINAPGQEDGARAFPVGFVYPSMENLSDMIPKVFSYFGIKRAVCLGDGVGANVFTRFARKNPSFIDALILVNPSFTYVGTLEWLGEKLTNITTSYTDQILNYHFSRPEIELHPHLLEQHRSHFQQFMNEGNVLTLLAEYERRDDIPLYRAVDPQMSNSTTLNCETMILIGDLSPFLEDAVEVNARLDPSRTNFVKMADAGGMILEEQVYRVSEAIIYFLQGLGHIPAAKMSRLARPEKFEVASEAVTGDAVTAKKTKQASSKSSLRNVFRSKKKISQPLLQGTQI
jgi:protein NDRG1